MSPPHTASPGSRRSSLDLAGFLLPIVIVFLVGANSLDHVTSLRPGPDAGAYALGGMMLKEGRVLYLDVSTTKPPMIYALNALALWIGDDGFHSIRALERAFAVAGALLVYFIVVAVFRARALAVLTAAAFSFYAFRRPVFEQGNVTEEYAIVFVLAGILCTVLAVRGRERVSLLLGGLAGACFSCAALTKQPFVLSGLPWLLLLVLRPGSSWRTAAHRLVAFSLGGLLPLALFLGYLTLNGALVAWFETFGSAFDYVAHSRVHYAGSFEAAVGELGSRILLVSRTGLIAFGAFGAFAALASPRFVKRNAYIPFVALLAFVLEFWGATISKRFYGHYFLQVLPAFVLCLASGGAFFVNLCDRAVDRWRGDSRSSGHATTSRAGHWIGLALIVLALGVLDSSEVRGYWQRLARPFTHAEAGPVSEYVRANSAPGDSLWAVPLANSRFNVETGLTPPPGFYLEPQWPTERTTVAEKTARLNAGGEVAPTWIVIPDGPYPPGFGGLLAAVCGNYLKTPVVDGGFRTPAHLYVRKDRAPAVAGVIGVVPDLNCPSVADKRKRLTTQVRLSTMLIERGEFVRAVAASEAALVLVRQSSDDFSDLAAVVNTNLCFALGKLKRWNEAEEACQQALAARPEMTEPRNTLSSVLEERRREDGRVKKSTPRNLGEIHG